MRPAVRGPRSADYNDRSMTPLRRLLSYFGRHKLSLTLGFLCVAISAAFSLAKPLIVGNAVDELAKTATRAALIRYSLLLVGAAAMAPRASPRARCIGGST